MENIYNIDRNLELCKSRLQKDEEIPEKVKKEIFDFTKKLNREGISKHRQYFYIERLKIMARIMGNKFLNPTPKDLEKGVDGLLEAQTRTKRSYSEGEGYSDRTVSDVIYSMKRFYRDYKDGKYLDIASKLKVNRHASKEKKPEDLVTKEELNSLLRACQNERDKALISMLYDSGCRIGELLTMRVRDVEYDEYGMRLTVSGKTGVRKVRVVGDSVALAREYQERYRRTNPDDLFFVGVEGGPAKYDSISTMLYKVSKRAGIQKRIHPHLFRHTRASLLARDLPEAPLESQMGWVHGSKMSKVYVSLSGEQQDEAVLRVYGIEKRKNEKGIEYVPQICPRCGAQNPGRDVAQYCYRCGMPLDAKEREKYEELEEKATDVIMNSKVESAVLQVLKKVLQKADPEFRDKSLSQVYAIIDEEEDLKKALIEEQAKKGQSPPPR
jgi:integrase